jgi:hypothetical protein
MFLRISRTFAVGRLDSLANHGVRNSRLMRRTGAAQAEPKFGALARIVWWRLGPGQNLAFDNALAQMVVLIAGSTGSALRAVRPRNLHITPMSARSRSRRKCDGFLVAITAARG